MVAFASAAQMASHIAPSLIAFLGYVDAGLPTQDEAAHGFPQVVELVGDVNAGDQYVTAL
jgi:hypothetical protein